MINPNKIQQNQHVGNNDGDMMSSILDSFNPDDFAELFADVFGEPLSFPPIAEQIFPPRPEVAAAPIEAPVNNANPSSTAPSRKRSREDDNPNNSNAVVNKEARAAAKELKKIGVSSADIQTMLKNWTTLTEVGKFKKANIVWLYSESRLKPAAMAWLTNPDQLKLLADLGFTPEILCPNKEGKYLKGPNLLSCTYSANKKLSLILLYEDALRKRKAQWDQGNTPKDAQHYTFAEYLGAKLSMKLMREIESAFKTFCENAPTYTTHMVLNNPLFPQPVNNSNNREINPSNKR